MSYVQDIPIKAYLMRFVRDYGILSCPTPEAVSVSYEVWAEWYEKTWPSRSTFRAIRNAWDSWRMCGYLIRAGPRRAIVNVPRILSYLEDRGALTHDEAEAVRLRIGRRLMTEALGHFNLNGQMTLPGYEKTDNDQRVRAYIDSRMTMAALPKTTIPICPIPGKN
ncbi:MAG: hypothetical protein MJY67_07585 [Bacteroidales bacterium]|nr:hypothetical protein [Bacteroidales bacterium]